MATPTKRTPVHIGNETYNLRYTHYSFVRLEEASSKTIQEHQQATAKGSSSSLSWLLWAGAVGDNEELTFQHVVKAMDFKRYGEYAEAIAEAMSIAMGTDSEPAEEGNEQGDS